MPNGQDTTSTSGTGTTSANTTMQQALANHVAGAVEASRKQTTRQLIVALILMLSGAVVGVISVELKDTAVAAGFGTALLGAGATLLPAGASASANAQLHNALTQLAILAAPPEGLMAPAAAQRVAQPQVQTAPQPQPLAPAPTPVAPLTPMTATAGQASTPEGRLALPAAAFGADAEGGVVTDAHVVSATDADAADAAALRAEQPD